MDIEAGRDYGQLRELHHFFNSRAYWGSAGVGAEDSSSLSLLELLAQFREVGELSLEYRLIELTRCPSFVWPSSNETEEDMWHFAMNRRGNSDLKDHMWSGYHYLRQTYPDEMFETTGRQLPFLYIAPTTRHAVTAGNVAVEVLLRTVVAEEIAALGVVAANRTWLNLDMNDLMDNDLQEYSRRWETLEGQCEMATLSFSPKVLEALAQFFKREDERLNKLVREIALKVQEGLPDWTAKLG
jgi:hypothetical protein